MKLYDMVKAPNPRRVRIFLAEKGVAIEREEVDIPSGANLAPAFLAVNPRGVVPALVLDDGTVIDESVAICRYFEMTTPEPNLMGRDPVEAATIESWQRRCEFDGMFAVASVFRNESPMYASRAMPGTSPGLPQIAAMAERGRALTMHWFEQMNARLAESEWVAGDRFTVADITALVTIDFAKWVRLRIGDEQRHLARWYAACRERPSYGA